ncbi:UNVERIFIED_CONTAM: hypothetical protein Sradi_5871400 [Sesamum radiatum]|uniref:Uncharacterized protein n=1 Tax=Sesamum radiatum TaxID=300843 RepID=A0AAW2KSU1_SESRA
MSTSKRVTTRAGASTATCFDIATETICWIAPDKAGDNSFVEVSEEVLHRGGSAMVPAAIGAGALVPMELGDPSPTEVGVSR